MSTADKKNVVGTITDPDELFRIENKWDAVEILKRLIGYLFLLPLRIIVCFGLMFLSSLIARIGSYFRGGHISKSGDPYPYIWWHYYLFEVPSRFCGRIMLFFAGFFWITVKGKRANPSDAPLLVSNHISDLDSIIFYSLLPISFVAKAEVGEMPIFGHASKSVGCIFVDRHSPNSKKEVRDAIIKRSNLVHEGKNAYEQLVIFPEETVTNGKGLLQFKAGAFLAGLPVQPVCLRFPHERFNVSLPYGLPTGPWMIGLFCQLVLHCEIEFLDVYNPSAEEKQNPILYGQNVAKLIAQRLEIPTTSYTFENAKAYSVKQKELHQSKKQK